MVTFRFLRELTWEPSPSAHAPPHWDHQPFRIVSRMTNHRPKLQDLHTHMHCDLLQGIARQASEGLVPCQVPLKLPSILRRSVGRLHVRCRHRRVKDGLVFCTALEPLPQMHAQGNREQADGTFGVPISSLGGHPEQVVAPLRDVCFMKAWPSERIARTDGCDSLPDLIQPQCRAGQENVKSVPLPRLVLLGKQHWIHVIFDKCAITCS
mmetsp:Transcript_171064/g.548199  ORF Transcript_171064/g.548199 Transcript_171064/m.548199 type:complete len:209 (-) Transcript_171064:471-1097(-)